MIVSQIGNDITEIGIETADHMAVDRIPTAVSNGEVRDIVQAKVMQLVTGMEGGVTLPSTTSSSKVDISSTSRRSLGDC